MAALTAGDMEFPLDLRFKLIAIASQIAVTDARGSLVAYVRQKAFKLKEAVTVYSDREQQRPLYRIDADRILDISARYRIEDMQGTELGVLHRHGMRSFWRAHYEIQRGGQPLLAIREESVWVRALDGIVGQVPIVGLLTGYILHPAYRVTRVGDGAPALRAVKRPALFEGVYRIERLAALSDDDERLAVLSILMMLLLERRRG